MIAVLYVLCALASTVCAVLLLRGYQRSRARLLLWSALCFCGLAVNNVMLVVDTATPQIDLSLGRTLPALVGMALLLWGLVWENR